MSPFCVVLGEVCGPSAFYSRHGKGSGPTVLEVVRVHLSGLLMSVYSGSLGLHGKTLQRHPQHLAHVHLDIYVSP